MAVNIAGLQRAVIRHAEERMERVGASFVNVAQGIAPRRSGAGADSIEPGPVENSGTRLTVKITVGEPYMKWQNEGTGIYGPSGQPITPNSPGGVLVFDWPAAGGLVFTRRVRGTEATHWWDRTLREWPRILREA